MSGAEFPDTRAELAAVNAQLARLLSSPDRDEARIVALDLRARALRRRLDVEQGVGLGPAREDGFYGSGF
jgi:capsule polysaccharide export protein KpsE/RkpR